MGARRQKGGAGEASDGSVRVAVAVSLLHACMAGVHAAAKHAAGSFDAIDWVLLRAGLGSSRELGLVGEGLGGE